MSSGFRHYTYELVRKWSARVAGRPLILDTRVPASYLAGEILRRVLMMIFGALVFGRPSVLVAPSTTIRSRSQIRFKGRVSIDSLCHIDALSLDGIEFGHGTSIGKRCVIECTGTIANLGKGLIVGDRVGIGSNSFLGCAGGVVIGDDTILGNYVSFHAENHVFSDCTRPIRDQGVTRAGIRVGKGCWIGAKVTILDGADIGDGCVVAAGAVVKGGIYAAYTVIGGVPARILKSRLET